MSIRLIFCFTLMSIWVNVASAGDWLDEITIDPYIGMYCEDQYSIYVNPDAIHILVHEGAEIFYYQVDYDGDKMSSRTVYSGTEENKKTAKIGGYGEKIYIVYVEDDVIYIEYSTNSGSTWSTSIDEIEMIDGESDGLSIAVDDEYLHVTWSEWVDDDDEYDTYHNYIKHGEIEWESLQRITNSSGDYGGKPSISLSSSRIHIGYTKYTLGFYPYGDIKTRDKSSSTWQTPLVVDNSGDGISQTVFADPLRLHSIFSIYEAPEPPFYNESARLYAKSRTLSSSTWSSATFLDYIQPYEGDWSPPDLTKTNIGNAQLVYSNGDNVFYRQYISSWGSAVELGEGDGPKIYNDYNDLYVIWRSYYLEAGRVLSMMQYDTNPPAATLSINTTGDHPVLSWNKVSLDAKEYKVYRKVVGVQDWHLKTTTSNLTWTDTGVFLEFPMMTVYYRIQAYDQEDNTSGWSNEVTCSGDAMSKPLAEGLEVNNALMIPKAFNLRNNYPNPFNPGTTIEFDLPEDNHVNLVVFNLNGQKVADLVEAFVPAGSYKVNFNAVDLPSGMYFYQITAGEFRDIKRMLLIK